MDNGRIIELLSDMLIEMRETNQRLAGRVEKLEEQQARTNVTLADVRLAVSCNWPTASKPSSSTRSGSESSEAAVFK